MDTLFILIAPNLFRILPTIRSRCRKVFFAAPPVEDAVTFLKTKTNADEQKIRELLRAMDGSIGLTLQLLSEDFLQTYDQFSRFLQTGNSFQQSSDLAQELVDEKADLPLLMELTKRKLFSTMKEQNHWPDFNKIDTLSQAQKDWDANVNKALILENLVMDLN